MKPDNPRAASGSLIERASAVYDFESMLRVPSVQPANDASPARADIFEPDVALSPTISRSPAVVDLSNLRQKGFIQPGAAPTILSEEFRLVKRQLLLSALGGRKTAAVEGARAILVCSSQPNEGKTFCSVNLALSMASESDIEVLLIDADVAKPEILSTLGIEGGAGLMDAISDPAVDVERLIIPTSVPSLSILPAGRQTHSDTEKLASARTRLVIESLLAANPARILIIDTAPVLVASPASVLAAHVGQILMVVRADRTGESELREAVQLLDGCKHIQMLLNGASYAGANQKYGTYYGHGG